MLMRSSGGCWADSVILADTGALYALADRADRNHAEAARWVRSQTEALAVHALILAEAWYLLSSRLGNGPARVLAERVAAGALALLPVDPADFGAALVIERQYEALDLGLTDAVSLALCEREKLPAVFTFDRRDFGAYKPSYAASLTLLP